MIKVCGISKCFGKKLALDNVSFRLDSGQVVALIGENGAGKSTLMRIMCGYLEANSGEVSIFGYNVANNRLDALKQIGYVPELSVLYGEMRVYDFLEWVANLWSVVSARESIIQAAKQINIVDVLDERIENLSKGYKKRVEIASAIIHNPKFLILDEPTDGLDPNQKHDIRLFMKKYAKDHIVLVSTHVLEDIDVADRIIMLSLGKIIKDASITDFKKISRSKDLSDAFRILSTHKG